MHDPSQKPNPAAMALLRSLPEEIKATITGEEAELFLFGEELPESLYHKIKEYLMETEE